MSSEASEAFSHKRSNCFQCGQCCRSFYPEIIPAELHKLKKNLPKNKWKELCSNLVSESPYQKEKAFPDSLFIKPPCPLLEDNLCSIHSNGLKLNSCTHWFCGRKNVDEPLTSTVAAKFWVENIRFLMEDGSILDPVMTAHLNAQPVGGIAHKALKKDTPADGAGEAVNVSNAALGYKNFRDSLSIPPGNATLGWAFQLTGVAKILATTWTYYFRSYVTGGTAHGNLGAQIRKNADNTLRQEIIAVDASGNTANFPAAYGTVSGTYNLAEYTVVDQTDWLVCYWYAHVTAVAAKKSYLRYDDVALAEADQVRITNVSFQTAAVAGQQNRGVQLSVAVSSRQNRDVQLNVDVAGRQSRGAQLSVDVKNQQNRGVYLSVEVASHQEREVSLSVEVLDHQERTVQLSVDIASQQNRGVSLSAEVLSHQERGTQLFVDIAEQQNRGVSLSAEVLSHQGRDVQLFVDIASQQNRGTSLSVEVSNHQEREVSLSVEVLNHQDRETQLYIDLAGQQNRGVYLSVEVSGHQEREVYLKAQETPKEENPKKTSPRMRERNPQHKMRFHPSLKL